MVLMQDKERKMTCGICLRKLCVLYHLKSYSLPQVSLFHVPTNIQDMQVLT